MPKRKAEILSNIGSSAGSKAEPVESKENKTQKRSNMLINSGSDSGSDNESEAGSALLEETSFTINEEYARRFEHNKKREELHRLEEKYQNAPKHTNGQYGIKYEGEEEEEENSSSDEEEDDEGFLATEALDAEISATLQAIRSKDPRVYDEKMSFYKPIEQVGEEDDAKKTENPMYLKDYHRGNLLSGYTGDEGADVAPSPRTFAQEQKDLKNTIIKEMHAAAEVEDGSSEDGQEGNDGFLIPKIKASFSKEVPVAKITVDPAIADKDPETFLSNFMAARAWVSTDSARFEPFESDNDEEDDRADIFEAAYNLRFEDPNGSNEMLKSYARDIVAAKSVRREEPKSRKRQREVERERKGAEKREREEDRARLRRLKIEEMEEKLQKIRKAAGLRGKTLQEEEWAKFLEKDWDDNGWEAEMNKRFGDNYYIERDLGSGDDNNAGEIDGCKEKKKKLRKPKWDDDIDIKDIIPEFEVEEAAKKPTYTLSDSEDDEEASEEPSIKSKSVKDRQQEKSTKKKAARLERKKIEELVNSRIVLEEPILAGKSKQPAPFRYRETSPISFGLTARDILMAPDASLNQFAGLKKMASFRNPEKKQKDKKRLGKKARLREWRRETFGNEDGPEIIVGNATTAEGVTPSKGTVASGNTNEGKKRRRPKKNKGVDCVSV